LNGYVDVNQIEQERSCKHHPDQIDAGFKETALSVHSTDTGKG